MSRRPCLTESGRQPPSDGAGLGQRVLFTLGALVIYRLGTYVPLPGIDLQLLQELFSRNAGGMVDIFSARALGRMTIFALNITPYLSASILLQLVMVVSSKLRALKNAGAAGSKTLDQYARIGALVIAAIEAYGIAIGLEGASGGRSAVIDPGLFFRLSTVLMLTAGTALLIWLGDQITARGVGNGIALIIFSGIVAHTPTALGQLLERGRMGTMSYSAIVLALMGVVALVAFVVFMERAQRRVLVQYPRRQIGSRMFGGEASHLVLKLNSAGTIPPRFASSLLLLPATIAGFGATSAGGGWLAEITTYVGRGHPVYLLLYVVIIVFFCFLYTSIIFSPAEMAYNLRKYGGFIPGIRPGKDTADHLDHVLTRLTLIGTLYIAGICVLPEILAAQLGLRFYFGGTSLLIVVCVGLDLVGEFRARLIRATPC
jgi:preprotein translocase subunit SecY